MDVYQIFKLLGGLGLFIYGMHLMSEGFAEAAGDRLRSWLNIFTSNRIVGVLVGTGVTAIIQSSSATTVMVVGFVNAGLMTLTQAVGVIMGANIGTTVTGILVAFKLTNIAPLMVFIGMAMMLFFKKKSISRIGEIVLGFGILFVGMGMMSASMEPLSQMPQFQMFMVGLSNPLLGVLVGAIVTGIIQSSSASVGILIVLGAQGLITLESAMPLVLGMNIGTCVTAMLASIGTHTNARRAAMLHLMFNIIGTVIFLILSIFIPIPALIRSISPSAGVEWQIATLHTIFNVFNTLLLLPFAKQLVSLVELLIKQKEESGEEKQLQFIDERLYITPTLVVPQLLKEVERMSVLACKNMQGSLQAFYTKSLGEQKRIYEREGVLNFLNHEITRHLAHAAAVVQTDKDFSIVGELYHVVSDIERVGDHAENILEYSEIVIDKKLQFSETSLSELKEMGDKAFAMYNFCVKAYFDRDESMIPEALKIEDEVDEMQRMLRERHIDRLNTGKCNPNSSMIFTDMLTDIERVADHALNIVLRLKVDA